MKIYDFSNVEDCNEVEEQFHKHFFKKEFVPLFGSGFTVGEKAKCGEVPSSDELKNFIQSLLKIYVEYTDEDIEQIKNLSLADTSQYLIDYINNSDDKVCKQEFFNFIENRFSNIHDITAEKKQLLNAKWQYMYTLNYDDTIERAVDNLTVIEPYDSQYKNYLDKQLGLYKIHGDVKIALSTGNLDYCVLSQRQYVKLLKDDSNGDMVDKLKADFASKNIIFLGCGLKEELDLLFVSDINLEQKKKNNPDTHCYYVRYNEENITSISKPSCHKLEQYGVTDIINVTENNINQFYEFVTNISINADALNIQDPLSTYTNISFSALDDNSLKNKEYLFYTKLVYPQENSITLPAFFIRRTKLKEISDSINRNEAYINVLRGSNLSGKTYALIDIVKEFHSRDIYYFATGTIIPDDLLSGLVSIKNAIIVFDDQTIDYDQMTFLVNSVHSIKKLNIHVVIAINLSSGIFTRHYLEQHPEMFGLLKITILPSKLDATEIIYFNSKIGNVGLAPFDNDQTFLDYIMQIEKNEIQKHDIPLPDVNIFDGDNKLSKLKALLLFANQSSISVTEMNAMYIDEAIYELLGRAKIAMQKEYLSDLEKSLNVHDNFRFIVNSKYWVYSCLSNFANNANHYNDIVRAFKEIVDTFNSCYRLNHLTKRKYIQKIKPYYFMDTIQFNFFSINSRGGSLTLLNMIYAELLSIFKDDYQFLHQKVKCMLREARTLKENSGKCLSLLNDASQQLARAQDLAIEKNAPNVEYTLYHMKVTRLLILINIVKYCLNNLSYSYNNEYEEIISTIFDVLTESAQYSDENEFDRKEVEDVKWAYQQLGKSEIKNHLSPNSRRQLNEIITMNTNVKMFI
jgi:hypothetical protein